VIAADYYKDIKTFKDRAVAVWPLDSFIDAFNIFCSLVGNSNKMKKTEEECAARLE
jgi:hypothetical protein